MRSLMLQYITRFFKPELQAAAHTKHNRHNRRHKDSKGDGALSLDELKDQAATRGSEVLLPGLQQHAPLPHPCPHLSHKLSYPFTCLAQPLVPTAAFSIGPTVRPDQLRSTWNGVSIPSTDGPKDSKQMAAFVRPWQMLTALHPAGGHNLAAEGDGGVDGGAGEGAGAGAGAGVAAAHGSSSSIVSSTADIEELFGDR